MYMKERGISRRDANVEQSYVLILQSHLMPWLLTHRHLASDTAREQDHQETLKELIFHFSIPHNIQSFVCG
jgi:hypothetical protein